MGPVRAFEEYDVQRIEDPLAFADLREEWDELLAASSADCLFLTWEWLHTWWKHLGGRRRLHLLLARDGRELTAIAPLAQRPPVLRRLLLFPALEFLGTETVGSDYLDVIVRRGREQEASDALATAWTGAPLVLEFAYVNRESSFSVALAKRLGQEGWAVQDKAINVCPVIDLAGHSWESYLAGLGSAHRYNYQRRLRNLKKRFDVRLDLVRTEAERQECLAASAGAVQFPVGASRVRAWPPGAVCTRRARGHLPAPWGGRRAGQEDCAMAPGRRPRRVGRGPRVDRGTRYAQCGPRIGISGWD